MYTEGTLDLTEMMLKVVKCSPYQREAKISLVKDKTKNRYLPAYEKVLKSHGQDYLVGNRLTRVDIHLLEVLLYVEELDSSLLAPFPLLKALKSRISSLPNVKKFLQPGSQRKPPIDAKQIEEARKIFKF
ncbi:glutathione S-transferase A2-like [Microtus pennsylvanicus]|uniref:glutathione S-transferase A2-like n=1 Tax=Microtus pennsylvanicus TaxID=10058 RepID=UPI003F6D8BFA